MLTGSDPERRLKAKVRAQVRFHKPWELAGEMLRQVGPRLPHRWAVGDTEFGRSTAFRDRLAKRGERYMLEVPKSIVVRKVAGKAGRKPIWHRVSSFLRRRPVGEWRRLTVRDGQKEPIEVVALAIRVQTRRHGKPKQETLLAMEALGSQERWFFVSNAPRRTPLEELVKAASRRHLIEEAFGERQGRGGPRPPRGAGLARVAPPHDSQPHGPVVPGTGAPEAGGKKRRSRWRWCAS